ncbi:hypothetical protein [Gracilimonas amylolytica]|uniref:hypothetical protein n=1 Tax=Gracilimonas amylolytica TaxID=1749045 RepID=UPI0012FFFC4E|nr:hypothetical protein [Gracilimonas amylolytica]
MGNISTCNKCGGTIIFRKMDGRAVPIHLTGQCSTKNGSSSTSFQNRVKRQQKKLKQRIKLVESFTIPNASCPECGASVFYYENEHGSKVFFDALGPPWPKHPCTDNGSTQESKTGSIRSSKSKDVWKRFYTTSLRSETKNDVIRIHWVGFFERKDNIWSKDFAFMTESPVDSDVIDLKTVFIAETKGGKIVLSMMKKEDSFEHICLSTKKQIKVNLGSKRLVTQKPEIPDPNKKYSSPTKKSKGRKVSRSNKKHIKEHKETKFSKEIKHSLKPVEDIYYCPFCTSSFIQESKLESHLREHWSNDDLGIFDGVSFKKWKGLILSDDKS